MTKTSADVDRLDILGEFKAGEFQAGEAVYDLGRSSPMVVTGVKGKLGELRPSLQELIRDNYTNQFFHMDAETPVVDTVFLNTQSKPSKTYGYPITRLARPHIENASGRTASQHAEFALLARMFALLETGEHKERATELLETLAKDATSNRVVDDAMTEGRDVADVFDEFTYELGQDDE